MNKNKSLILIISFSIFLFSFSSYCFIKKDNYFSDSERRLLKTTPHLTADSIFKGEYMKEFDEYVLDQFPFRDSFRKIKAISSFKLFNHSDNNDIYIYNKYLIKKEYPLNMKMLDNAIKKFNYINDKYLKNSNTKNYISIIPDKNYFLRNNDNSLTMDYDFMFEYIKENLKNIHFIDITENLELEDYYYSDSHWRQERIIDVASELLNEMNNNIQTQYENKTATKSFQGVYAGQLALKSDTDVLNYLTNQTLENCIVTSYSSGKPKRIPLYNFEKVNDKDPYEMFLNGTEALLTIENSRSTNDKELVIFRDSFTSSLAPLLMEGYSKITLIDIRYIQTDQIDSYVTFNNQDVLFMYSSTILNNSLSFR